MSTRKPPRPLRRLRFLVQVIIGVLVFTWVPTIAQAAFSDAAVAPVTVGTYDIPAPVGGSYSRTCASNRSSMTVNLTTFGAVDRATGYTVTLTGPSGQVTTNRLPANTRSTSITTSSTRTGSYTLQIRATVGTWTGDPLTATITCP